MLEDDPSFAAYLDSVPKFKEAIQYARKFYLLRLEDQIDSEDVKGSTSRDFTLVAL